MLYTQSDLLIQIRAKIYAIRIFQITRRSSYTTVFVNREVLNNGMPCIWNDTSVWTICGQCWSQFAWSVVDWSPSETTWLNAKTMQNFIISHLGDILWWAEPPMDFWGQILMDVVHLDLRLGKEVLFSIASANLCDSSSIRWPFCSWVAIDAYVPREF